MVALTPRTLKNPSHIPKREGAAENAADTHIPSPRAKSLGSRSLLMYWVNRPNIDRAAMDGSNQTTIIRNLTDPRAITIDYTGESGILLGEIGIPISSRGD
ncbi:hypothetical protein Bbelb_254410 [Branchiostoma belcheri]|nr:hypothetical protein Bbelb_254410 [Branchiostoma belcheri]